MALAVLAGAFGSTALATWGVLRLVSVLGMLDRPIDRSSHRVPTPRGGGLAIGLTLLGGVAVLAASGLVAFEVGIALGGGGFAVAAIGWFDDRVGLGPVPRVAVHVLAAGWAVLWLGGMPAVEVGVTRLDLGWVGSVLAVLGVVWMINLYNFMDGADGLAAGVASVAGIAGYLMFFGGSTGGLAMCALLVAGAGLGFLGWNWSPAKIFMGDVGSGLIGFWFGVLALAGENVQGPGVMAWTIVLAVFVVDATFTLVRRAGRGERWYAAHRRHAYQRLILSGWSHPRVSAAVIGLSVVVSTVAIVTVRVPRLTLPLTAMTLLAVGVCYGLVERIHPFARSGDHGGPSRLNLGGRNHD